MSDQTFLLAFSAVTCLSAVALALLLGWLREGWSKRKIALLSALPVPGILALLLVWVIGRAYFAGIVDPESCGVDACGMAIGFSMIGLFAAFVVYGVGVGVAATVVWLARR